MAESYWALAKRKLGIGRPRHEPRRETEPYPRTFQLGVMQADQQRPSYKPVARNLRFFARTPYARRAINAIKDPIAGLSWEIRPKKGVELNAELERQIEVATYCFDHPNEQDSFRSLIEQVTEDFLCGGAAIETALGGDADRPLWMWPVDGLSIQIFAFWDGSPSAPHYFQTYGYGSLGNLGSNGVLLRDDELIYVKPNPTTADPFGCGRLEVAFLTIAAQIGAQDFAGLLASNAKPSVLLNFEGADGDKLDAFREYWRNDIEGRGLTPITGGKKVDAVKLWPDGDKALFLEWQNFCIRTIAASFDLSPQNMGLEADVNRNTSEVAEDRDWDQAIKPTAHALQEHLTRHAIHRRLGFSQLEFVFTGLDREDELATAEIYDIYYKANVLTPNEQRERMGEEPSKSEWADMTYADVQIAMAAAKGVGENLDTDLPAGKGKSSSAAKPRKPEVKKKG